jgi:DNA-binding CsgD family transcriptional regulator
MTLRDFLLARNLSNREAQVIELVSKGMSNKEVSNELSIKEGTVKEYLRMSQKKLRTKSRAQIIIVCLPYLGDGGGPTV